jgi:hypothetical protein
MRLSATTNRPLEATIQTGQKKVEVFTTRFNFAVATSRFKLILGYKKKPHMLVIRHFYLLSFAADVQQFLMAYFFILRTLTLVVLVLLGIFALPVSHAPYIAISIHVRISKSSAGFKWAESPDLLAAVAIGFQSKSLLAFPQQRGQTRWHISPQRLELHILPGSPPPKSALAAKTEYNGVLQQSRTLLLGHVLYLCARHTVRWLQGCCLAAMVNMGDQQFWKDKDTGFVLICPNCV